MWLTVALKKSHLCWELFVRECCSSLYARVANLVRTGGVGVCGPPQGDSVASTCSGMPLVVSFWQARERRKRIFSLKGLKAAERQGSISCALNAYARDLPLPVERWNELRETVR